MCLSIQYIKDPFSFSLLRHDVAEVAGLTSFSFGEDEESRYVMLFKKVCNLFFCDYFHKTDVVFFVARLPAA